MVRERSLSSAQDDSDDPPTTSSDNPPSYEESVAEDWNTNLTWPNTLANREELQSLFQVNNYDYSSRGRAFTVTGGSDPTGPRYRNIINYFENSLDDMSSVDWSKPSITRSYRQIPQQYNSSSEFGETTIARCKSVPGPRNTGTRTNSRDVGNWQYLNETKNQENTRFTVQLVQNTDDSALVKPPEYSFIDKDTGDSKGMTGTLSPLTEEKRPTVTTGTCDIDCKDAHLHSRQPSADVGYTRQPSAPSLDEINQEESISRFPRPCIRGFTRTETAPGRLTDMGDDTKQNPLESSPLDYSIIDNNVTSKDIEKSVKFLLDTSDENVNPNIEHGIQRNLEESLKKENTAVIQILNSSHAVSEDSAITVDFEKKESRSSETGDSGYGEESFNTESTLLGLRSNYEPRLKYLESDESQSKLINMESQTQHWENHHLFRIEEDKKDKYGWKFLVGVSFFVMDVILILAGALVLILDYHSNVIVGFTLLGIGIGLCVPALNYLGGFPTVCGGMGS